MTVKEAKLRNGDMIYITVNADRTVFASEALAQSKVVTKDGSIVTKEVEGAPDGFRPGMVSSTVV